MAGKDKRAGTGKVVAEAMAQAAPLAAPARQLSLLGDSGPVPELMEDRTGKPGRPAGARNVVTRETRAFILSQYRDPLVTLARMQSLDPVEAARAWGCKPIEAADRIRHAADALAPYLHGKMPVMDGDGNAVLPIIQLVDPSQVFSPVGTGPAILDLTALEVADFRHSDAGTREAVGRSELDSQPEDKAACGVGDLRPVIKDHDAEGSE